MNYLGIDYGTKRIGLAKADDETKIATPLTTILNDKNIFGGIWDIVTIEQISEIILGVPISFDGKEYELARKARQFGKELGQKLGKEIHFQNEVLSTKQAERQEVGDIDASAAALILQSFLDQY